MGHVKHEYDSSVKTVKNTYEQHNQNNKGEFERI